MVTLLAWMAHRLVSSNSPTKYASAASWSADTALLWNLKSVLKSCAISLTSLWNGSLRIRSSVLFWYFLISLRATVPGLKRWGFFTPPVAGADFRAALVASCFLGAFPPVDLRAVCLVRAIWEDESGRLKGLGSVCFSGKLERFWFGLDGKWRRLWGLFIYGLESWGIAGSLKFCVFVKILEEEAAGEYEPLITVRIDGCECSIRGTRIQPMGGVVYLFKFIFLLVE